MSEDDRTYTDEEFALVLRRAAELAGESGGDLSLDDMRAIAEEVGIEPALIERAVHRGLWREGARSLVARQLSAFFPVTLTKERAAHLLTVISAVTGQQGVADATASGLVWRGGRLERIVVTAHNEAAGCRVEVSLHRAPLLLRTGLVGVLAGWATAGLNEPMTLGGLIASVVVGLGVAAAPWAFLASRARRRMDALTDAIGRTMAEMREPPGLVSGSSEPNGPQDAASGADPDGTAR